MKLKFVHIPKAGGSSIWRMFGQHVLKPEAPYKIPRFGWHQIYENLIEDTDTISFTISRNPYDRAVSAYHYLKAGGVSAEDHADGQRWCHFDSFEEFCLDPMGLKDASENQLHFLPQSTFLPKGVDMIGSIENIDTFLDKLCRIVNIERPKTIQDNKSDHKEWKHYYKNPEVVNVVKDIYLVDFIKFNYPTTI